MELKLPVAVVDDLKSRWPDFPEGNEELAETLLNDAAILIQAHLPADANPDSELLKLVVCQMVKRIMATSTLPEGVTSVSQTVGPFATQMGFSNNSSSLFLTKAEKKLLGIGIQQASNIDLLGGADEEYPSWPR